MSHKFRSLCLGVFVVHLCGSRAAIAAPFGNPSIGSKPYGVLLLAQDGGGAWKTELGAIRAQLRGVAVESVESAAGGVAIQRALDRLRAQRVDKIVAVPLEIVSESPVMDEIRYLFGIRAEPTEDRPDRARSGMPPLRPENKRALILPSNKRPKRLKTDAELVLTATIDQSAFLVEILTERARVQSRRPEKEAVVLAGLAPRSDKELPAWKTAVAAIAEAVRAKGGFREAGIVWVRDGVRSGQQDKDRAENQAMLRRLVTQGEVVAVPLAPDGRWIGRLLTRQLGGGVRYRWNGKGLVGDKRLALWVQTTSEAASKLPDVRQYRDGGLR